ncbi:DUF2461 domain-containing protein [Bacteroidota bacterium]
MPYFSEDFIAFFKELSKNNSREWFEKNKQRYEESVKKPFYNFIEEIIHRINMDDESINITPKESIFRIHRDIRFSKDKTPYKIHAGAVISPGGRKNYSLPGYYIQFSADDLRFYGGTYQIEIGQLQRLREHITANLEEFESLIKEKKFKRLFGQIQGEENKRIPKEFNEAYRIQPLIVKKHFYFYTKFNPEIILSKALIKKFMGCYNTGRPLIDFFRAGVM